MATDTIVFLATILIGLLAAVSADIEFFGRYFTLFHRVNLVIGALLMVIIGRLMLALTLHVQHSRFGTWLMTKLAMLFGVADILPGMLVYLVSLQFVSHNTESQFDMRVESALEADLNLRRSTVDVALVDLQNKDRLIVEQADDGSASATTITFNQLCEQFGVQETTIFTVSGHVIVMASDTYDTLVSDPPGQAMLEQAYAPDDYASLEGGGDTETDSASASATSTSAMRNDNRRSDLYQLHIMVALDMSSHEEPSPRPNTSARKRTGTGLLTDHRSEDGSNTSRGFGLIGESGRKERFLQLV